MSRRNAFIAIALVALTVVASALPAAAAKKATKPAKKPPAVTKLDLSLDQEQVDEGDEVTGSLRLLYRSGKVWLPVSGATISLTLDGVSTGSVTTAADGTAAVSATAEVGVHTLKIAYAGSTSYRAVKRARGFDVLGTWYTDADVDGYGDAAVPVQGTSQPEGSTEDSTDCDDSSADVNPGATEVEGNEIDEDCDGVAA